MLFFVISLRSTIFATNRFIPIIQITVTNSMRTIYLLLTCIIGFCIQSCHTPSAKDTERVTKATRDSMLQVLDETLANTNQYLDIKYTRIAELKDSLQLTDSDKERFNLYTHLYDEYIYFRSDSAYYYVKKSTDLAQSLNKNLQHLALLNMMQYCINTGLFKEAYDIHADINPHVLDTTQLKQYYLMSQRMASDMASHTRDTPYAFYYISQQHAYSDSAMMLMPETSFNLNISPTTKNYNEEISRLHKLVNSSSCPLHEQARLHSILGHFYRDKCDVYAAQYHYASSALRDIITSTTETTAMKDLAVSLFHDGDYKRANIYIHKAFDDANFFNSRHRKLEVQQVLPLIDAYQINSIKGDRKALTIFLSVSSLLCVALFFSLWSIAKKRRRLRSQNDKISHQLDEISSINAQLVEATEIKDAFVIHTLYSKTEYLEHVEEIIHKIELYVKTKQYQNLRFLRKDFDLKKNREEVHSAFDETFLKLFPNFVDQFNQLFAPEDAFSLTPEGNLTPELRIFALMRLGITDTKRISTFLSLNINTIYVYRAKIKSKSLVSKEEFEQKVSEITK